MAARTDAAARQDGATMVEYGFLITLIAAVVAVGAAVLGTDVSAMYSSVATSF